MTALARSATARTTALRRLADSERLQRSVLDVLDEGVIVVDRLGRLDHANRAACSILDLDVAAARADRFWWRAIAVRSETDVSACATVLRTGQGFHDVGVDAIRRDGTSIRLSVNYEALRDETGAVEGMVLSFRDVTEKELAAERAAAERDLFQTTLDSLSAHIAVLGVQGEIVMTNLAWIRFACENGAPPPRPGTNYLAACDDAAGDADAAQAAAGIRAIMSGSKRRFSLEYPCHSPTRERWFVLRAERFGGAGSGRVVVAHEDVTERRLAESKATLGAALLEEVDAAVVATGVDGALTHWNRGAEEMFGWTRDEVMGHDDMTSLITPPGDSGNEQVVDEIERSGRWEGQYTVCHRDGTTFPAFLRIRAMRDGAGEYAGRTSVIVDMSAQVESERALRAAGLYLRAVADNVGEGLFTLDTGGCVTYMNAAAERLLGWSFAELQGRTMHAVTHVQRPDGPALPIAESPILEAVRDGRTRRVEDDVFIRRDGRELPIAYTAAPFETSDGVHGCVVAFEDISERKAREQAMQREVSKLAWIARIQDALAEDRFVLYAQPIVDLSSGEVVQRELLLRMREPDGAIVGPGEFLGIAEQYGLIGEIDRWVIGRGAELAAAGSPVEINLSARSVGDRAVLDHIDACLRESGADPGLLVFEITETALIADEAAGRTFAKHLHLLGCKLALDDFGTGYGGFTYLKQLPLDLLKIDIEFVGDLTVNAASRHVVQAVVALARGFDLQTVAEGVEDAETLELLRELGVDFAQGYHIARPAPLPA